MKISKIELPEEIFGMETGLLVVFLPVVGLILLMIVTINLVLSPKIKEYQQMAGQYRMVNLQLGQVVQKKQYLQSIDQKELTKNATFIANAMLPQKNSYVLVEMVEKMAANYGYQINSFLVNPGEISGDDKAQQVAKVSGVANIPVTLTIVGPASKYLDLINGLETSLPVLSLSSFKMKTTGDTAAIDLNISAYYITDTSTFDISKLTLADLTMSSAESAVITKLGQFTVLEDISNIESGFNTNKEYVKYNRSDPFNP
jgi:hypothetical protein